MCYTHIHSSHEENTLWSPETVQPYLPAFAFWHLCLGWPLPHIPLVASNASYCALCSVPGVTTLDTGFFRVPRLKGWKSGREVPEIIQRYCGRSRVVRDQNILHSVPITSVSSSLVDKEVCFEWQADEETGLQRVSQPWGQEAWITDQVPQMDWKFLRSSFHVYLRKQSRFFQYPTCTVQDRYTNHLPKEWTQATPHIRNKKEQKQYYKEDWKEVWQISPWPMKINHGNAWWSLNKQLYEKSGRRGHN
jgi:hypothetical protein